MAKDRDNGDEVPSSHLVTRTKCRAVFRRLLLEMITPTTFAQRESSLCSTPRGPGVARPSRSWPTMPPGRGETRFFRGNSATGAERR